MTPAIIRRAPMLGNRAAAGEFQEQVLGVRNWAEVFGR